MGEFIENIKKDSEVQEDISHTLEKCNEESYANQSKFGESALIQSSVFGQTRNIMVETIADLDVEIEEKDNEETVLENKIGIADSKCVHDMNELDLNKKSSKKTVIDLCID